MKFAIRDDDVSFFTKSEGLEKIHKDIGNRVPLSLSVIPFSVKSYNMGDWSKFCQDEDETI